MNMDSVRTSAGYQPPAVTYEAELEARAGSPLGLPDPLDLAGFEQ